MKGSLTDLSALVTVFVECTDNAVHVERENKDEGIFSFYFLA